jgi:hypothetical protein
VITKQVLTLAEAEQTDPHPLVISTFMKFWYILLIGVVATFYVRKGVLIVVVQNVNGVSFCLFAMTLNVVHWN